LREGVAHRVFVRAHGGIGWAATVDEVLAALEEPLRAAPPFRRTAVIGATAYASAASSALASFRSAKSNPSVNQS
jgi:hypothetical protein